MYAIFYGAVQTHQHCRAQVELVKELRDKHVHLEDARARHVLLLNVVQDVDEPLEASVGRTHPEEVDFLAGDARIAIR